MTPPIFFDLHVHSTLKPFLLSAVDSPWEDYDMATPEERVRRTPRLTASDFTKLLRSGTRVITLALHPIERYLLTSMVTRPVMYALIFRMRLERMRQVLQRNPFLLLQQEYQLLLAYLRNPGGEGEAIIVQRPEDIDQALQNPKKIAIILAIEGAHALGFEYRHYKFPKIRGFVYDGFLELKREVIRARLNWAAERHVHLITLVHMLYNDLATPARAVEFRGLQNILPDPYRTVERLGRYRGLTAYGVSFVEEAYKRHILIDVKHCDYVSRREVYEIARDYGMPVVASHVAVSGRSYPSSRDTARERRQSFTFNPWDINLHDEDIVAIARSGGLIGLILDERVLAGEKLLEEVRRGYRSPLYPLTQQIEYIYTHLTQNGFSPQAAISCICIGSDFDGFIDPIDAVPTVLEYPSVLYPGLVSYFQERRAIYQDTGLSPEELAAAICGENGIRFWKAFLRRKLEALQTPRQAVP
jgi:microsomal dipeptidase-like Zn-dependent dipeptidase